MRKRMILALVFIGVLSIVSISHLPWSGAYPVLRAASAAPLVARNPRLTTGPERTTLIVDISRATKFRIVTLSSPYRVLVDLWDHRFERQVRGERGGQGLVLAARYGQLAARVARTTLITKGPVRVEAVFVRARTRRNPLRLEVRLSLTDHASFIAGKTYLAPPVFAQDKDAQGGDSNKPIIIIDPGHGGRDPGAIGTRGTQEKHIIFSFSQALRSELESSGRYEVHMTREGDGFVKLPWRVISARLLVRDKAARSLFISIHADSVPSGFSKNARGASVYVYSEKPADKETMLLVKNENRNEDSASAELQNTQQQGLGETIPGTESQRRYLSTLFAEGLLSELGSATDLRWKRPRSANFYVLTLPDVPSVLLELGFISNLREEKRLGSQAWRKSMAAAAVRAIETYFDKLAPREPGLAQAGPGTPGR